MSTMKIAVSRRDEQAEKIEAYSFDQVRAKVRKNQSIRPDQLDEAVAEFKKYLQLISMGYAGLGMMSPAVDEVWHTFILFTRDYMEFCNNVFGQYLHHQPAGDEKHKDRNAGRRFMEAYVAEFGPVPAIWMICERGVADCTDCTPVPSCSGEPSPT